MYYTCIAPKLFAKLAFPPWRMQGLRASRPSFTASALGFGVGFSRLRICCSAAVRALACPASSREAVWKPTLFPVSSLAEPSQPECAFLSSVQRALLQSTTNLEDSPKPCHIVINPARSCKPCADHHVFVSFQFPQHRRGQGPRVPRAEIEPGEGVEAHGAVCSNLHTPGTALKHNPVF